MSETGRKDVHDKLKESVTPNVMKSDTEKAKETFTDATDRIVREVQPDSSKSSAQEATDKIERSKDNTKHGSTHETIGDKVKHVLGMDKNEHTTH